MLDELAGNLDLEAEGLRVIAEERISSDVANISPAVERLVGHLRSHRHARGREDDVDLALREALTNAVIHGNGRDPDKPVWAVVATDDVGGLFLIVRDTGDGFDPTSLPDPIQSERVRATHGRGVFLMRTLMRDVVFRDGGREVRMRVS